jgi:DNA-binding MarR family transcriptional regulator
MNRVDEQSMIALRRITRALDVHSRTLLREYHLTAPQLALLQEVERCGQAPIGSLAKAAFLGAPTATGIVDRLEKQGLVARVRSQSDRRQVLITITAAGRQLLRRNPPSISAGFHDQLRKLSKGEQRKIGDVLQQVADMMETAVGKDEVAEKRQPD